MRDAQRSAVFWDPAVISGCFMFFRTKVLKHLKGFDPRFFVSGGLRSQPSHCNDFANCLCTGSTDRASRGHAVRKGLRHMGMFVASAFKFYNKNGWKWF